MYNAELKIIVIFDAQIIEAVLYHINCGVMCHLQFASIKTYITVHMVEWLTLLLHIQEVPGSNLRLETSYPPILYTYILIV
jgi:hypothetical protein